MNVLCLNVGSSSLKLGIYDARAEALLSGQIDLKSTPPQLSYRDADGTQHHVALEQDEGAMLQAIAGLVSDQGGVSCVAHRIVHGGPHLRAHCLIDAQVLDQIEQAASFAPLHVPPALAWIRHAQRALADAKQVACFDTAFHHPLPDLTRVLPLPHALLDQGVERYGFHGLSCESVVRQLDKVPSRLIVAHLGSGASITAIRDGHSIDTSMGMTPTGGIVMGTRPGDLDPGVCLFLLRQGHCTADQLEKLLEKQSGLLGISGLSADVRTLGEASDNPWAKLALEQFALSAARQIAGMAVSLGGADVLVFTGGIGEHHAPTRKRVSQLLQAVLPDLPTQVVPAKEEWIMARYARQLAQV